MNKPYANFANALEKNEKNQYLIYELAGGTAAIRDFKQRTGRVVILDKDGNFESGKEEKTDCTFQPVSKIDIDSIEFMLKKWSKHDSSKEIKEVYNGWNDSSISKAALIGDFHSMSTNKYMFLYFVEMKEEKTLLNRFLGWFTTLTENDLLKKSPTIQYGLRMSDCLLQKTNTLIDVNMERVLRMSPAFIDFSKTPTDIFSTLDIRARPSDDSFEQIQQLVYLFEGMQWVYMKPKNKDALLQIVVGGLPLDIHPIMQQYNARNGDIFYLVRLAYDPIFVWVKSVPGLSLIWETSNIKPGKDIETPQPKKYDSFSPETLVSLGDLEYLSIDLIDQDAFPEVKTPVIDKFKRKIQDNNGSIKIGEIPEWFRRKKPYFLPTLENEDDQEVATDEVSSDEDISEEDEYNDLEISPLEEYKPTSEENKKFGEEIGSLGYAKAFKEAFNNWENLPVGKPYDAQFRLRVILYSRMKKKSLKEPKKIIEADQPVPFETKSFPTYLGKNVNLNRYWYLMEKTDGSFVFYQTQNELKRLENPQENEKSEWEKSMDRANAYVALPPLYVAQ